jgi:teichuronic acid exporter
MSNSLKSQTIYALTWSLVESLSMRAIEFLVGVFLARLLYPEQFGLIAMLTIFISIAQAFSESGFGAALVQKKDATHIDSCSIFYFNIVIGVLVTGLLYLSAPGIARFYQQPDLTLLTRALSITILINSFGLVQNSLLTKQINFKAHTKISLMANIPAGILGVTLALKGFGVWSLAIMEISRSIFRTISLWLINTWRPKLIFSLESLRVLFGFGSKVLITGIINRIFENIYFMVIGKIFSARDLGYYSRAKALEEFPSQNLSYMVGRVTFPVFSTIQDDSERLKRGMKKALTFLAFVNFPMMIGLMLISRPLIIVLLTEKWEASILYLQLLCLGGLLFPINLINLNVIQALGRSDLNLRIEIIKKIFVVLNIAITWRWGISAMIMGMILFTVIAVYLNSYYTNVLIGYSIFEQSKDMFIYLVISGLMGILVFGIGQFPFNAEWVRLATQVILGGIIYLSLCKLFRLEAFIEIWEMGKSKIADIRGRSTSQ